MFRNEPLIDFTFAENRASFQGALDSLDARIVTMSLTAGPLVGGKELSSDERFERYDPSDPSVLIGITSFASIPQAEQALTLIKSGAESWGNRSTEDRAQIIKRLATLLRRDKLFLSALIIRESGKPWKEADADVAEAIDFCDFYAEEALKLGSWRKTEQLLGEDNWYFYQPRGVALVISPWNFPLAIACGMSVAALVTGNTTILKPSEQTSLIAFEFAKLIFEAGVPCDAFAFLPGWGEEIGRALVASPDIALIAFTGSKAVGLEILKKASEVPPGQSHIKKVIAELGGKNAVIVDEDADLDEAVKGILYSAFGFSGQKCSACSRVICVGTAYEPFLERMKEAVSSIIVGNASDPATFVGPVIDQESCDRIKKLINTFKEQHDCLFYSEQKQSGYFVGPAIFKDVPTTSALWTEEIFGPVLACRGVHTLEEAISEANNSQYALTGGLFSRSPHSIELTKRNFRVGNLYINRGCTGAMVCRQPFGGFKLSGIGSKAGGTDYLLQFVEPRCISENTMRRGFAPQN